MKGLVEYNNFTRLLVRLKKKNIISFIFYQTILYQFIYKKKKKNSIICIIFHKFLIVPISMHKQCSIHNKIQEIEQTAQTHSNDRVLYYWICWLSNLARPDLFVEGWRLGGLELLSWYPSQCVRIDHLHYLYSWCYDGVLAGAM